MRERQSLKLRLIVRFGERERNPAKPAFVSTGHLRGRQRSPPANGMAAQTGPSFSVFRNV